MKRMTTIISGLLMICMSQKSKFTFTYGVANDGVSDSQNAYKILDYTFKDEFDMLKQFKVWRLLNHVCCV